MKYWLREIVMLSFSFILKILAFLLPKQKGLIILGGFGGNRFADNSSIIYKYILNKEDDLRPVWLTNNNDVINEIKKLGGEVYKRRSLKGIYLSLVTPIYITSHGIKDVLMYIPFAKTPKHIYVHHGIPLRKGWLDIKNAPRKSRQSTFDKINTSNFMIAPSLFAAEQQNKLLPIGLDKFAMTGLPRNDVFFDASFDKETFKKQLNIGKYKKVLLYCPTWRPWGATTFFPFPDYNLKEISTFLDETNTCLVLRPHHVDLKTKSNQEFWNNIKNIDQIRLITHDICPDVNHLCMISDGLITDYSSLYYDYLLVNKPVIFLEYDFDRYNKEIGFYPDYQEITHGDKPKTQIAFIKSLGKIINNEDLFNRERNDLKNRFYDDLDNRATDRIVKLIRDLIQ